MPLQAPQIGGREILGVGEGDGAEGVEEADDASGSDRRPGIIK